MTQISLQMKTGIDQSLLSKYELGTRMPTCENLMLLAEFFNTSMDYLMGLTDVEKSYPRKDNDN